MKRNRKFLITDLVYIAGMCLPLLCGMILKILTEPPSRGISITGARVFFTVKFPIQDLVISEAQINSWLVLISILFSACT